MFTSGFYHIGILYPNDGKCHLDEDGYYTESKNQDYPSVSQINYIAQQVCIVIQIFFLNLELEKLNENFQ